jgi:4-hydroxybenzoate polyprenyltransferase
MLIVAGLGALTALYGFVEIPFLKGSKKLRDFGLIKTIFVAVVWSVTTVLVPLENTVVEPAMMWFLLIRRFIFVGALTMVFEIKDMEGDWEHGLKTLPLQFGVTNTKLIAQGHLFLLTLINLVQYFFFHISVWNMAAVNLSLLVSIICIQPLREETSEIWYYLVLDGMMILQFVFVYFAAKLFG